MSRGRDRKANALTWSSAVYMFILLLLAITNGYVSTLIMVRGVSDPALYRHEIDVRSLFRACVSQA